MREQDAIVEAVREHYAEVARRAARAGEGRTSSGCGCASDGGCCTGVSAYYAPDERTLVPAEALAASAGCGNPVALADLHPGEVVLDLGSGGGIDVLLSARRVGPGGYAWGVDMTREMLELAEENRRRSGLQNVGFLEGRIEEVPLPDASVDVVISNCVINLSVDKAAVLREAFRVLRPGGRLAVYDIVAHEPLSAEARRDLRAWSQCVSGALDRQTYVRLLREAGFVDVEVQPVLPLQTGGCCGGDEGSLLVGSAFVRARKPGSPDLGDGRLTVEAASRDDLPAILHLLERVGLPTDGVAEHLEGFVVARRRMPAPGGPADGSLHTVATVVGCAGVERYGPQALLRSVAVSPPLRGVGIGQRLVAAALERARSLGASEIYLLTTTASEYFARLGFQQVEPQAVVGPVTSSPEFTRLCPDTAVVMRRELP